MSRSTRSGEAATASVAVGRDKLKDSLRRIFSRIRTLYWFVVSLNSFEIFQSIRQIQHLLPHRRRRCFCFLSERAQHTARNALCPDAPVVHENGVQYRMTIWRRREESADFQQAANDSFDSKRENHRNISGAFHAEIKVAKQRIRQRTTNTLHKDRLNTDSDADEALKPRKCRTHSRHIPRRLTRILSKTAAMVMRIGEQHVDDRQKLFSLLRSRQEVFSSRERQQSVSLIVCSDSLLTHRRTLQMSRLRCLRLSFFFFSSSSSSRLSRRNNTRLLPPTHERYRFLTIR